MTPLSTVSTRKFQILVYKRLRECDKRLDNHDKKFGDLETQITTIKFMQPPQREKPQPQPQPEAQLP
jgi:hypothetical protein